MNHLSENTNPFASAIGGPIAGKEPEFFSWEQKKHADKLNALTNVDREKQLAAEEHLAQKMNS